MFRIVHNDPGCRVCRTTGLVATADSAPPYPNPEHANPEYGLPDGSPNGGPDGVHWYHGTASDPAKSRLNRRDEEGVDRNPSHGGGGEYGERADMHWNTDLGVHFSSMHHVAQDDFAANDVTPHSRIMHATLHMRNPAIYKSEHDLTNHAITWAHDQGYRYLPKNPQAHKAFLHRNWEAVEDHDEAEGKGRSYDYHQGVPGTDEDRQRISHIDQFGPKSYKFDPDVQEKWLGRHPERERINDEFRMHLQLKGHDGIVYGNEYEGPDRHPSAIAFPSTPVHIQHTERVTSKRKKAARVVAAIRMVPPEEYGSFHYPDYPQAKNPAALVKHFKKTSPEYYDKVKQDVQENGFTTPVLVRWNDPGGRPLKKPHVMEGHHRAAVAHELGLHLPVGDYDDNDDYDVSAQGGRDWFSKNQRPTGDMPHQGRYTAPTKRIFGPTYGLDVRLFDGEHLKPDVRKYILETLSDFWKPKFGLSWDQWARVYFAGSEASEWTSESLQGNNDFDVLIGVDYNAYRDNGSHLDADKTNEEITAELNAGLRKLDKKTDPTWIMIDGVQTGPWSNTWYVNPNSYDIRDIRPYAAYDVTNDKWAVKPPHLPDWDLSKFPQGPGLAAEVRGVVEMAKGIMRMPEPYRTQQGAQLWEYIHSSRSNAFGPNGEGWWSAENVLEKALDQTGLMQKLWALHDRARKDPTTLAAPAGWSNDPSSVRAR